MGLDLGEKRIGVAVADTERGVAFPDRILLRQSAKVDRRALASLAVEQAVDRIVVGLPLSMDGEEVPRAHEARRFAEYLQRVIQAPVEVWDERLTTVEADERLRASGMGVAERRKKIDAAAAAIILEDYMRAHQP